MLNSKACLNEEEQSLFDEAESVLDEANLIGEDGEVVTDDEEGHKECPECGWELKRCMIDLDGTNIEEGYECTNPDCDYEILDR